MLEVNGGEISVQVIHNLRALEPSTPNADQSKVKRQQTLADQMFGVLVRIADGGSTRMDAWRKSCFAMMDGKKDDPARKLFTVPSSISSKPA